MVLQNLVATGSSRSCPTLSWMSPAGSVVTAKGSAPSAGIHIRSLCCGSRSCRSAAGINLGERNGQLSAFYAGSRRTASAQKRAVATLAISADVNDDVVVSEKRIGEDGHPLDHLIGDENGGEKVDDLDSMPLSEKLKSNLRARGITTLFPVQRACLVEGTAGRDVVVRAKTGTGKTLAFTLPMMEKMLSRGLRGSRNKPVALVLAPTRELAKQVEDEVNATGSRDMSSLCVYGGTPIFKNIKDLGDGPDILVGTPGRVIDLLERGCLNFANVGVVVLDEADQMLDRGFAEDVDHIMAQIPDTKQTMLFSATMPQWVVSLTGKYLNDPHKVDLVGSNQKDKPAETIDFYVLQTPRSSGDAKWEVMAQVLQVEASDRKAIVFARTKMACDQGAAALRAQGIQCRPLHGDISQAARDETIQSFRENQFGVLVATDVAARGLDIPETDLVVHCEPPESVASFLHRSGRTGRAGRKGKAVLMFEERDFPLVKRISRESGVKFQSMALPSTMQVMQAKAISALRRMKTVNKEVVPYFEETAGTLLSAYEGDSKLALAYCLAAISGVDSLPKNRSLLTLEEGMVTVGLVSKSGSWPIGRIVAVVQDILRAGGLKDPYVGKVKRVDLSEKSKFQAVFDMKESDLPILLDGEVEETRFEVVHSLPVLEGMNTMDELESMNRGWRNGRRGGSSYSGSRGRRNYRDSYGERDRDRGRRGSRSYRDEDDRYYRDQSRESEKGRYADRRTKGRR